MPAGSRDNDNTEKEERIHVSASAVRAQWASFSPVGGRSDDSLFLCAEAYETVAGGITLSEHVQLYSVDDECTSSFQNTPSKTK